MKTKLIQALREAARKIVDPASNYAWTSPTECNCGILASCVIGRNLDYMNDLSKPSRNLFAGYWSDSICVIELACERTGLAMPFVFAELRKVGINAPEICYVEYCSHPAVLSRMGYTHCPFSRGRSMRDDPTFVARYFTAWADMLEEEQPAIPTTTQDQIKSIESRDVRAVPVELQTVS